MHVTLYFPDRLPVPGYGGTQRMVLYLARGLAQLGHQVTLIAAPGSSVPEARLVPMDPRKRGTEFEIAPYLPADSEMLCAFAPAVVPAGVPWVRVLPGNRRPGSVCPPNTLFLSADHARRHGGTAFVYNGIDPADFEFRAAKDNYDLFLGRLHRAKGYRWAIDGAKRLRRRVLIAGGWRPSFSRYVRYVGEVGGKRKADLLAGARCLWMPAQWEEPFGITLIEAMVSGTPVLGTRRGSLPEIISPDTGMLANTLEEMIQHAERVDRLDPEAGRARVERYFTHVRMAEGYLRMFEGVLETGVLPAGVVAGG